MSVASAVVRGNLTPAQATSDARLRDVSLLSRVACLGVIVLVLVAPFEALRPLLRVPGQSFTTVETILLAVFAMCATAVVSSRAMPDLSFGEVLPWGVFVGAAALSAGLAPAFRANALHMTARYGLTAAVWCVCVIGAASEQSRRQIVRAGVASGTLVALLVIADFVRVPGLGPFLALFRGAVAVVGTEVRASGPFQYPTIASMFLEITFALGLGLLVSYGPTEHRQRAALVVALALMAEAVVLTFTRSGLITTSLAVAIVGAAHAWRRGLDRGVWAVLALIVIMTGELLSSRSAEGLRLRLTSEGQGRWFSAVIEAPSRITVDTMHPIDVPIRITNTGRATWDSFAPEPVRLSYHWIASDSDEVIAWEGTRTTFASPVRPGESVSLLARVGSPGRAGQFRLMWDIEQQHRLWFSTEPDADVVFTPGVVTGPDRAIAQPDRVPRHVPKMAVRPGRFLLWTAAFRMTAERPLVGVGPDNYRLLYGRYAPLAEADPRVHSNNMYIEVLAGTGLAGAAALLWVGLRGARAALTAAGASDIGLGVAAAAAAIAVHGLADSFLSFTGTYILIAVIFGLASAYGREGERHAHCV